jgi:phage recombination protein Bet
MIEKAGYNAFTNDQIDLIKRTICKSATNDELLMFMQYCKKTGLDPFSRQIWSIERKSYNSDTGKYEASRTIQVSIDGFRLVAERTGKYIGQTPVMWCGEDGVWVDAWVSKSYPVAAKVGVYRSDFKEPLYSVAKFDSYVSKTKDGKPTQMWAKMPDLMIAKCAEALALRKAFPMELSGLYTNDEMDQAEKPPLETEQEQNKKTTKEVESQKKQKIDPTTILNNITSSQSIEELQKSYENAVSFMRANNMPEIKNDIIKRKNNRKLQIESLH